MFNDDVVCVCWEEDDNGCLAEAYEEYCIEENLFSALKTLDYDYSLDLDYNGNVKANVHTTYYLDSNLPIKVSMPLDSFLALMKHRG